MQLNVSTCYAMQVMLYLARNKKIVPSTELATTLKISQRYILQIVGRLRDEGYLATRPGASGGISLGKNAAEISAYDVITLMEGDMSIPECITPLSGYGEPCMNSNLHETFSVMKDYIDTYFKIITFDKLEDMKISRHLSAILGLVTAHIDEMRDKV